MYCLLERFKNWPVESIMKSQVAGYKKCYLLEIRKKPYKHKPYKEKPYRRKAQQFLISM